MLNRMNLSSIWCKKNTLAILETSSESSAIHIGIENIDDEMLLEKVRFLSQKRVLPQKCTPEKIRQLLSHKETDTSSILEKIKENKSSSWESEPIANLVDCLIRDALQKSATDIHLEPTENTLRIRFRIDGMLCEYKTLPAWLAEPILIRLKVMSEIDITERRLPHDGSFQFENFSQKISVRVSTLPISDGEKCVLRLLPPMNSENTLEKLSFSPKVLQELRRIFRSPQGLFLVTGPTGSGKTTTLYAGLREISKRKINITTIEDPVEYEMTGVNQVQVNEKCGFTFAAALRSILRQDPDAILIGEIRDAETAQIALRAAQTGHLVLSTLHTNSAEAAFTRLADLGISEKLLQESLLGILAQRLVRKIANKAENDVAAGIATDAEDTARATKTAVAAENAATATTTAIASEDASTVARKATIATGDASVAPTFYKGRIAIAELFLPDRTYADGTLHENALRLIQKGITDEKEVERVVGVAINMQKRTNYEL